MNQPRHTSTRRSALVATLGPALLAACGGGGSSDEPAPPPPPPPAPAPGPTPPPVPVAPTITRAPQNMSVRSGESAAFDVQTGGGPVTSYQWLLDSVEIPGATAMSYSYATAKMADSGKAFSVRVSNAGGTVTSAGALLTVAKPVLAVGITVIAQIAARIDDLALDAQGNSIVVTGSFEPGALPIARKYAPDGSELPYGPDGKGLVLPGAGKGLYMTFSGAAFSASGDVYVTNVEGRVVGLNAVAPVGGSLYRVSPNGQATQLAAWPADSAGAIAPASPALGPDGALYFVDYLSGGLLKRAPDGAITSLANVNAGYSTLFSASRFHWLYVAGPDDVYVVGRFTVLKRVQGGVVRIIAGDGVTSGGNGPVDGTGTAAAFLNPVGIAGNGNDIFISDANLLRKVTPDGTVTTVAGQRGANDLLPGPLPGRLGGIGALTVDGSGTITAAAGSTLPGSYGPSTLLKIRLS